MFQITDMTSAHLDEVYQIETRSFAIPWSKSELRKEIEENKHAVYKAAISPSGELAGYAGLWHIVNEGHITNIAVDSSFRRMGVGSMLVEALIKLAREREMIGLTLEVRTGNAAARGLYEKYGFKPEGIRKRYYADTGEDAIIMWKYF
jgi:ribosomal-protein-alanine N-acetyltransferase